MEPSITHFAWSHLPPPLAQVSAPFGQLAERLLAELPPGTERGVALRKLLEAKDAAVRAALPPRVAESVPAEVMFGGAK